LESFDQEALAKQRHYLDLDLAGELTRLELYEAHVAAEEVDHLAQIARLL
jgi:hypothetical protein